MTNLSRQDLRAFLGHPTTPSDAPVSIEHTSSDTTKGIRTRRVRLVSGAHNIPAIILAPDTPTPTGGHPGIVYCHAHGDRFDIGKSEALSGRPATLDPPLGVILARAGYVVMCADMTGFGERQSDGPESALAKDAIWHGRSLLGDMLLDQALALRALCGLEEVDANRTAAVGISMGATLSYFLAALTPSITSIAHMCCFANMGPMIASGAHDLHGIYMVVPGLLKQHELADVAAMVAPRPQLVCTGLADTLTPEAASTPALAQLRDAYARAGAPNALRTISDPSAGHEETQAFRAGILSFFSETLNAAR